MKRHFATFNSDVVIKAIDYLVRERSDSSAEQEQRSSAHSAILLAQPAVRMPTLAWMEVMWCLRDEDRTQTDELVGRYVSQDSFTRAGVLIAVELVKALNKKTGYCKRCWGIDSDAPCTKCQRIACKEDRRNDVLILASAIEAMDDGLLTTLYSFDGLHHHFAEHEPQLLRGLKVERPPLAAQLALGSLMYPAAASSPTKE